MTRQGMVSKKLFIILIWMFIVFSFLIVPTSVISKSPSLSTGPEVTLTFVDPEQYANVGPYDDTRVVFHGIASVKNLGPYIVEVSLTCSDTWNSAKVEPSTIVFLLNDQGDKEFNVTVKVQPYSSVETIGRVNVYGKVVQPSSVQGKCNTVQGIIRMNQYHKFQLRIPEKYLRVEPGETAKFNVEIDNIGNGNDTFSIRIKNLEKLRDQGLEIAFPTTQPFLAEDGVFKFSIKVQIPSDPFYQSDLRIELEISIVGVEDEDAPPQTEVLKIKVRSCNPFFVRECYIIYIPLIIIGVVVFIIILWRRRKLKNKKPAQ